ncbi:hypothetical protein [uncultured Pseudoteredinibacter sp.]|uniref:ApeI family dehydratase n=1 Tax=uncultured Pseudoteredinibacter sp. TaxID=1641701 RepID=UPI002616E48A|nr:hypothetical protein [uncultured Pseudoteredinibacter sp.]
MKKLFPEALLSETDPECINLQLNIDPEIVYFDGHFPEQAILPGVTQIFWAEHFARIYLSTVMPPEERFSHLEAVKFQQVIRPNEKIQLQLEFKKDKQKLYFKYFDEEHQFSSGRMVYTQPSHDGTAHV